MKISNIVRFYIALLISAFFYFGVFSSGLFKKTRRLAMTTAALIAQIPAGKSKTIPPLHGGLQLSKIAKKNNHVPYNMRCWKCCLPSSTHFWHLVRKSAFTRISNTVNFTPDTCLQFFCCVWGF